MSLAYMERRIKELEDYLGPRLNWTMGNKRTGDRDDHWIMWYCFDLKSEYYRRKIKRKKWFFWR